MEPKRITPEELKRRLDAGERVVILDDRAPDAWQKSDVQIPGSWRVPPDQVEQHLQEISKGAAIATYCT